GVEPLQQKLGRAARDAQEVAEPGERDLALALALLDKRALGFLVRSRSDDEAVADADKPALLFEKTREVAVVEPHRIRPRLFEPGLERLGLLGLVSESSRRARQVSLASPALELEERKDRLGPRCTAQQLGRPE